MFKSRYHAQLLLDLASQGVNAVLVEYEDIFPFDGIDIAWDPSVCWTTKTLQRFLALAEEASIEVIPLQQTLGHLEYVFRWKRYRRYAEDRKYPSTLALSSKAGRRLVVNMLEQVLDAHPNSRYVHIGMDEAHALTAAAERDGRDVLDIHLAYLDELCRVVEARGVVPIMWSDMLEDHFNGKKIAAFADRVVLAPWDYRRMGEVDHTARLAGFRVSRRWLNEPDAPAAPAITPATPFLEDWPPAIARLAKAFPGCRGRLRISHPLGLLL